MTYQEAIATLNKTHFSIHNSIAYRKPIDEAFRYQICLALSKSVDGIGVEFTHGNVLADGTFKRNDLLDACWTEETFNEYLDMLRAIHPEYGPMLECATFERPIIKLNCDAVIPRFSCMCFFRSMWERPKLAHTLLELYRSGEVSPVELCIVGAMIFERLDRLVHWFTGSNPASPSDWLDAFYNDKINTVGQVDSYLKTGGWGGGGDVNIQRDEDMADPAVAIEHLTRIFWKGERPDVNSQTPENYIK